ncbi:MAG: GTP cyclohydrolase [Opitutaceae bacterium]|jgi:3,4-dihydroxy 2-butanone 4-phosphate synthase/GTP cyclohydrolase II|nr:GTP cyclohydrolase [Opitutaceae bacterium]
MPKKEQAVPAELLARMQPGAGSVPPGARALERPLLGTTLYITTRRLDTRFGEWTAHVFQDIADKHHILALTFGDVSGGEPLHTRLHSSCLTSETLCGCDCDCSQQLEGAFRAIAARGRGILFYLMQEGRGVGFFGKARDRMLVQASGDRVSTFAAYEAFGLRRDHRNYGNIPHICRLLGIQAPFIVLTNNPDKVRAIRAAGFSIAGTEPLEFEPGPFNIAYLSSKADGGHALRRPSASRVARAGTPEPLELFRPEALPEAPRFIRGACYFLPIRPPGGEVVLGAGRFAEIFAGRDAGRLAADKGSGILAVEELGGGRRLARIDAEALARRGEFGALLTEPCWFRAHAYYDTLRSRDAVVLTHGDPAADAAPVARAHGESLFERFPLRTRRNRDLFQETVRRIARHGAGVIVLTGGGGLSADPGAADAGVDCDAALRLLRHHVPGGRVRLAAGTPDGPERAPAFAEAARRLGLSVEEWLFWGGAAA